MAAYNFPDDPFIGEQFAPINGPSWQWDGDVWRVSSIAPPLEAPEVSVGDDLPTIGAWNGQLWWESDTGKLYVWYDDESSAQWVQIIAPTLILDATDSLVKATGGSVSRKLSDWFAGLGRNDNPAKTSFWSDQGESNDWRFRDRVFVGDASNYDGALTQANGSWLGEAQITVDDGNIGQHWLERSSQLYSNHTEGGVAVLGVSRLSDRPTDSLGHTTIGVAGYAYANADPGDVWGGYFEAARNASFTNAAFGLEVNARNLGDEQKNNPYDILPPGGTFGLRLAAGGISPVEPFPVSDSTAALVIGDNTARWLKGIVFDASGLQGTDGLNAGKAIAIEMAQGQAIKWRHAAEEFSTSGEIRSDNNQAAAETRIIFSPSGLLIKCMDGTQASEVTIAEFPINPAASVYPSLSSGMAGVHLNAMGSATDAHVNLNPKGAGILITPNSMLINSVQPMPVGGVMGMGLQMSTVANFGVFYGTGDPMLPAALGSVYMRADGIFNERIYVNTDGNVDWSPLIDDVSNKADITHVGSGGAEHALAIPGPNPEIPEEGEPVWIPGVHGLAGFISGPDQAKLNSVSAGVGASINRAYTTPGSTLWIKPVGIVALEVELQAGGGGGGGANAALGQTSVGSGGAGGGGVRKFYDKAALEALDPTGTGVSVIVGAGGIGGALAGSAGGAGSLSSFGTLSATGGAGGNTSGASNIDAVIAGASPGTGTGGDENRMGGPGHVAIKIAGSSPYQGVGGVGGTSAFGGGGGAAKTTNDVPAGPGDRGSGGSGGYSANGGGGSEGGVGGTGYVRLREYY
jgi:hypothetical protein